METRKNRGVGLSAGSRLSAVRWQRFAVLLLILAPLAIAVTPVANRYAVILSQPGAVQQLSVAGAKGGGGQDQMQRIITAQATLRRELEQRKYHVTGSVQRVLNALFVEAKPQQVAELRSLPGVQAVVPVHRFRLRLDRAVQLENVPAAWAALGGTGNAGAGIKIGILDTGIDQTHPAFQDSSLSVPAGFPKCQGKDCAFTNKKVIVARSYVPLLAAGSPPNPAVDSRPDDYSPRDHVGHGTGLAMITAGVTNSGPTDTITGLAPKAWLGNYKVFGSPGVNDFTGGDVIIQALEDALNDGMDVAVLALGSPALSGPLDTDQANCGGPCDVEAVAVENAVQSGMVVAVSAGNGGDSGPTIPTLNTIESPATAPSAIAAGASTNSHVFYSSVNVTGANVPSNLQSIRAMFGDGPLPPAPLTAPVRDVAALDSTGFACNPLPAGSLNGAFALVLRSPGMCTFAVKVTNAQNAGAVGAIIIQSTTDPIFTPGGLTGTEIPAAMIANDDGVALKAYVDSNANAQATLNPNIAPFDASVYNTVAAFSSHGPSITYLLKPELVAVGTDIYMATQNYDANGEMYDPSRYTAASGTSFSAPMAAGAVALVKQKNPKLTAVQLKSAIVNTATQDVTENGATASAVAAGNGKLSAGDAIQVGATVDPATLSLGALSSTALPASQQLTLHNAGSAPVSLTLGVTAANGRAPSLNKTSLSLAAAGQDQVTLTVSGGLPSPGIYTGAVTIQGAGAPLRVPYLYVVGDGVPANVTELLGADFDGQVGQVIPDGAIVFKITDQYGVAIPGVQVRWNVAGGGTLSNVDAQTDRYGMAGAVPTLGPNPGTQEFDAHAGGFTIHFSGTARLQPTISPGGVVNAASFQAGQGIAPGSYIAIFGTALSDVEDSERTVSLPPALDDVSVSFDVPSANLSLPGHLLYISPGQINLQVPWELQGQTSVMMKVTIGFTPGQVITVPVSNYAPAMYTSGQGTAAAVDMVGNLISSSNPAKRGSTISLYMNGLGPVSNQPNDGEPASAATLSKTAATPTVTIGGQTATVQFSGLAPGYPGLNQVNVTVPPNAPLGSQRVIVTIGSVSSPALNLPVGQ